MSETLLYTLIQDTCPKTLHDAFRLSNSFNQAIKELCYGRTYAFYLREIMPSDDNSPVVIPRKECDVLVGFILESKSTNGFVREYADLTVKIGEYKSIMLLRDGTFSYADRYHGILPLLKLTKGFDVHIIDLNKPIYAICAVIDNPHRRDIIATQLDDKKVFYLRDDIHIIKNGTIVPVEKKTTETTETTETTQDNTREEL